MPEAVIVATARTPIGRANKGSLTECRPDDLCAHILKAQQDDAPEAADAGPAATGMGLTRRCRRDG